MSLLSRCLRRYLLIPQFVLLYLLQPALSQDALPESTSGVCIAYHDSLKEIITARISQEREEKDDKYKSILESFDQSLTEEIKTRFDDREFVCDENVNKLVRDIVDEIRSSHSDRFPVEFIALISKEPTVNAQSIGHQTIIVHAGLLSAVRTREELRFVIAHEMAHDYLNHREKILKKMAVAVSKSTDKELANVIKNHSSKREALIEYFTAMELNAKAFSRKQEFEADSVALLLTQKLSGPSSSAILAIKNLLRINQNDMENKWRDMFNFSSFPFQDYWDYIAPPIVPPDTLPPEKIALFSTHPNIEDRLKRLQEQNIGSVDSIGTPYHLADSLDRKLLLESLGMLYERNQFHLALFEAFKTHHPDHPDEDICIWIGRLFYKLHQLRSLHQFESFIPNTPFPVVSSYDQLILIINNMRMKDLVRVGYYFLDQQPFHSAEFVDMKKSLSEKF